MSFTQTAFWLGTSALVSLATWSARAQTAQPVAPAVSPAPNVAPQAPAPASPPAATGAAPAPATSAPAAPPASEPPVAPAPPAPPVAAAPTPIQLAPASNQVEERARAERAKADSRAAVRSSPFMDVTLNGTWLEDRYGDPFVFGVQGGAYLGELVRLTIRLEMPTENARDEYSNFDSVSPAPAGGTSSFTSPLRSKAPTLLYGATVGAVATSSDNFVFSPGLVFMRSDVSDYGSMLGVSMPFEWVTSHGMRFGLELDLGRAFGGTVHNQTCTSQGACTPSDGDRPPGRAFALRFQMGFGFNRARK